METERWNCEVLVNVKALQSFWIWECLFKLLQRLSRFASPDAFNLLISPVKSKLFFVSFSSCEWGEFGSDPVRAASRSWSSVMVALKTGVRLAIVGSGTDGGKPEQGEALSDLLVEEVLRLCLWPKSLGEPIARPRGFALFKSDTRSCEFFLRIWCSSSGMSESESLINAMCPTMSPKVPLYPNSLFSSSCVLILGGREGGYETLVLHSEWPWAELSSSVWVVRTLRILGVFASARNTEARATISWVLRDTFMMKNRCLHLAWTYAY
jgi:hypothetical protein